MAPGRRKKKDSIVTKITSGIGMVFLCTIGLPVVIVGGTIQILSTGLSYLFCPNDGYSNGKRQEFRPMRKGVRIYPM